MYAWVSPEPEVGLLTNERLIGTFRQWKLIQVVEKNNPKVSLLLPRNMI